MLFRSIRWQIQLWYGLLLVLITGTLLVGFYQYERIILLQNMDRELTGPLVSLLPLHIPLPGQSRPPGLSPIGRPHFQQDLEADGFYTGFWTPDGKSTYLSPKAPGNLSFPVTGDPRPRSFGRWNGSNYELIQVTPMGDVALIGMTGAAIQHKIHLFGFELAAVGLVVITLGLVGGWFVTGWVIRPIGDIASTAEKISAGDHARRIEIASTGDELGRLATVLNTTFDRLAQMYEQQVRFTADASHELRTPVSVILAQTQMVLSRERDSAAYREALEICQRSAQRMKGLLGELIDLSRYDMANPELRIRECDLAEVVREALEFVAPMAEEKHVEITSRSESVRGRYDPVNLSHVLINLLMNAVKHNPEGCRVSVTLQSMKSGARLVVSDAGKGIPPESLPHIFDRFYRVDPSRARNTGGSGLGLAIVKAIVEAHKGTIEVVSTPGQGTTFTIVVPEYLAA